MLFAIMASTVLLTVSILTYYILILYIGMGLEISAMVGGAISAIIIMEIDHKKSHFRQKIIEKITLYLEGRKCTE